MEYSPKSWRGKLIYIGLSLFLFGSVIFGNHMGGLYWLLALAGAAGALYGFWKMPIEEDGFLWPYKYRSDNNQDYVVQRYFSDDEKWTDIGIFLADDFARDYLIYKSRKYPERVYRSVIRVVSEGDSNRVEH